MKYLFLIGFLFLVCQVKSDAQENTASLKIMNGERSVYDAGDSITFLASVHLSPEICADGMAKSKIFLSGMEMVEKGEWTRDENFVWIMLFKVCVKENKKDVGKITVSRNGDVGAFFTQMKINVNHGGSSK